jgi:hypothetical protein
MSTKYSQPKATNSMLKNVKSLYSNMALAADQLQPVLIALITAAFEMPGKREILDEAGDVGQALDYLFRNTPRGIDRGTLSAWFVKFTPIRPKFNKGNAHYEGIGFKRKNPTWDLEGAEATHWGDVDPECTREVKIPELDRQIKSLMKAAAKIAAVSSNISVKDIADAIQDATRDAEKTIMETMSENSVMNFVDAYAEQNAPASEEIH